MDIDNSALQILSYLIFKEKANFNEIVKQTGLSSRTVSLQLKKLEKLNMIKKIKTGEDRFSKVFYTITDEGVSLINLCIDDDVDLTTYDSEKYERLRMLDQFILDLFRMIEPQKKDILFTDLQIKDWYSFAKAIRLGFLEIEDNKISITKEGLLAVADIIKRRVNFEIILDISHLKKMATNLLDDKVVGNLDKSLSYLEKSLQFLDRFRMLLGIEVQEETLRKLKEELLTDEDDSEKPS